MNFIYNISLLFEPFFKSTRVCTKSKGMEWNATQKAQSKHHSQQFNIHYVQTQNSELLVFWFIRLAAAMYANSRLWRSTGFVKDWLSWEAPLDEGSIERSLGFVGLSPEIYVVSTLVPLCLDSFAKNRLHRK